MAVPAEPSILSQACSVRRSGGIVGDGPQRNGAWRLGGVAMIREYEFQRSVRVSHPPSNVSLTRIGLKPTGTAIFSGMSTDNTIRVPEGRLQAGRVASATRSDSVALAA